MSPACGFRANFRDNGTITLTLSGDGSISGTIDLGGGNEITFVNIEQIVYTDLV